MTIKIEAWQAYGIKRKRCVDKFEFCCWRSLFKWLMWFGEGDTLHGCPDCCREDGHINITSDDDYRRVEVMSDKCIDGAGHLLNADGYACAKCGVSAEHLPKGTAKLPR